MEVSLENICNNEVINKLSLLHLVICLCYRKKYIYSLVFSPSGRSGRNQSPVMEPMWLLALHPRQILGDSLPLLFPAFRGSHFRPHVPLRPQRTVGEKDVR